MRNVQSSPFINRNQTGVVMDDRFLDHKPGANHPDSHLRLANLYALLQSKDSNHRIIKVPPRMATREEVLLVHTSDHFKTIAETIKREETLVSAETVASSGSYYAAMLAIGGVFNVIDAVLSRELTNAIVLSRPPGHHAEQSRAMGFCFFNNVALGAAYARQIKGLKRIFILDWDIHHGNGIQHIFERDPSVYYVSIHQYPLFPGTGHYTETGIGAGEGYTMNIPIPKGFGDTEYITIFHDMLGPLIRSFGPDLILVSAGFDAHRLDPIGGMQVTSEGFAAMTRYLMYLAEQCCHSRLILVLEGGYHLEALSQSVQSVIRELMNEKITATKAIVKHKKLASIIYRCIRVHGHRWNCLNGI